MHSPGYLTYGPAGDLYPCERGDVWIVGDHILACGDLEQGDGLRLLDRFGVPAMAYCDPPYNKAQATQFRHKAGDHRDVDFLALLQSILATCARVEGACYLEMGVTGTPALKEMIAAVGGTALDTWSITYNGYKPAMLVRATFGHASPVLVETPGGMDDVHTPRWAIEHSSLPGELVLDCCLGRGLTAKSAHMCGRRVLGMELHPRRLACAVHWLSRWGLTPHKQVGALLS